MCAAEDEILHLEEQLRAAMLKGDVAALSELLDEELEFVDQHGARHSKAADLAMHRSRRIELESIDRVGEALVKSWEDTAIVSVTLDLAGLFDSLAFFGRFTYSRVWHRRNGTWRIVQAHCSAVPATS